MRKHRISGHSNQDIKKEIGVEFFNAYFFFRTIETNYCLFCLSRLPPFSFLAFSFKAFN